MCYNLRCYNLSALTLNCLFSFDYAMDHVWIIRLNTMFKLRDRTWINQNSSGNTVLIETAPKAGSKNQMPRDTTFS